MVTNRWLTQKPYANDYTLHLPLGLLDLMPYNTGDGGDDDGYDVTMMWSFSFEPHFREYFANDLMCPLQNDIYGISNSWMRTQKKTESEMKQIDFTQNVIKLRSRTMRCYANYGNHIVIYVIMMLLLLLLLLLILKFCDIINVIFSWLSKYKYMHGILQCIRWISNDATNLLRRWRLMHLWMRELYGNLREMKSKC